MSCVDACEILGLEAAAIAFSSGQCNMAMVANDHAVFDKFYVLNSRIVGSAAAAIAFSSGRSQILILEKAQAGLDRFCALKDSRRLSEEEAIDCNNGGFGTTREAKAHAVFARS
mmetsp:Transcript_95872/g.149872  ORF Transcript_95872/g.149872 Transcript_95872/m.149872 type:complete len:114 (-) Transcript_95872:39-380(-)